MSVQQDKRVIKPSKMSERYARWFGTRVPSTSRMFRYMVMSVLAIAWFPTVYLLLSIPSPNPLLVFLASCGVGIALYSLYLSILEIRFRSRTVNEQFAHIVQQAHERAGSHGLVHVWQRRSPDPYIVSTFNSLFNVVIVSEPMVDLILKMPSSGEAVLGFHLLHRPNRRNVLDIVAAVLVFSGSSFYYAWPYLGYPSYSIFYFLLRLYPIGPQLFVLAIFVLILRSAFWSHDSAFERAAVMYKVHPQVARDEVLSSSKLDEEAAKAIVWVVREWEREKRNGRRLVMAIVVPIIFYVAVMQLCALTFRYSYTYGWTMSILALAATFLLVPSIYLLLRRWDNICMNELYYETTDAHKPIWVD